MWKSIVILLVSLLALSSCKTSRTIEETIVKTDTLYVEKIEKQRFDSIVYVHDSIIERSEIYVTLDSAGKEINRIENHVTDRTHNSMTATNNTSEKKDSVDAKHNENNHKVVKTVQTSGLSVIDNVQILLCRLFIFFLIILIIINFIKKKVSRFS